MKNLQSILILMLIMTALTVSNAQNKVGVGDVFPGKVEFAAFTLSQNDKVKIEGTGGAYHHDGRMIVYYGWILDSDTRKIVWHTADNVNRPDFDYGSFEIDAQVSLPKGTYEVYFSSAFHNNSNWNFRPVGNLFGEVFGDWKKEKYKTEMQEGMGIEVSSASLEKQSSAALMEKKFAGAIVSIVKPDNDASIKKGFSLGAPTSLRIYSIGEGGDEESFDYAWIYDVNTRKRVWVMDYANTDFAGGAEKNLVVDEKITLPAGDYMVSYTTDDSHSYNDWNAMPPHDPQFSGITIWANSEADKKNVIAFRAPAELQAALELTRVRDDDYVSKGLSVKAGADFRLLCLGESSSDDELADYGWIMNASTREIVWDMSKVRTEHAGGAEKNRMVDAVIHLDKGDYIVYYVTDGSHSYHDWNAGPPHEQDSYGISLWPTKKDDISKVALFEPTSFKSDKVLVEIVRVRDDESLNEAFTLDKDTNLRIFALGEGVDGDMVDYGWIKNTETGKVVWEMTYRNTDSAGGATKNRMYNDTIILPKGTYKVYYETDGSHSYRKWNASPPRDPEHYGISLIKEIN
jgi:hypothetical protein